MDHQIIFWIKGILLTEALTHAVRSGGIFDGIRESIARASVFFRRLTTCFECLSVWTAFAVFIYLVFLDFWPITFIIIISRLATVGHIFIDLVDAHRASTVNKI